MGTFASTDWTVVLVWPARRPPLAKTELRSPVWLEPLRRLGRTRVRTASHISCTVALREASSNATRDEGPMLELSKPFLEVDRNFPSDATNVAARLSRFRRRRCQKYHAMAARAMSRSSPIVMPTARPALEAELLLPSWWDEEPSPFGSWCEEEEDGDVSGEDVKEGLSLGGDNADDNVWSPLAVAVLGSVSRSVDVTPESVEVTDAPDGVATIGETALLDELLGAIAG